MKKIAIETNGFFIKIFDISTGVGTTFPIIGNMTAKEVYHRFIGFSLKSWMNLQTIQDLKGEVIKSYPNLDIDWKTIMNQVENVFRNRKASSIHVGFKSFGPGVENDRG